MKTIMKIAFGIVGGTILSTLLVVGLFSSEAGRRWYRNYMTKMMALFMED